MSPFFNLGFCSLAVAQKTSGAVGLGGAHASCVLQGKMVNFQQPTADHRRVVEEASQILMKELPPRVVRRFSQRLRTNDTSLRNLLSDKVMFIHDGVVSHGPKQVASQIFESHRFQSVWHDWYSTYSGGFSNSLAQGTKYREQMVATRPRAEKPEQQEITRPPARTAGEF